MSIIDKELMEECRQDMLNGQRQEAYEEKRLIEDYDYAFERLVLESSAFDVAKQAIDDIIKAMNSYGHIIEFDEICKEL